MNSGFQPVSRDNYQRASNYQRAVWRCAVRRSDFSANTGKGIVSGLHRSLSPPAGRQGVLSHQNPQLRRV